MAEVARSAEYALDIHVPTYNHLELTITCLDALYKHTRNPFHLIITDYSNDLTPLYLAQFCKEHDNVTYIHSDAPCKCGNVFFNRALAECKTPFMATVMNSVRVEPDWDIGGLQVLNTDPKIGIVGFKSLMSDGTIESAWIQMNKWLPCDVGRGEPGHRHSLIHEVQVCQWAFALLRVTAGRGNLDENVFNGHVGWDDIDNCFVLRNKGWKIFYCGASAGYHHPRATRGNDSPEAAQRNRENGIAFYKRWGFWDDFVKDHGENGAIHSPPKPRPNGQVSGVPVPAGQSG